MAEEDEDEDGDDDDDEDVNTAHVEGMYDPEEFASLDVSPEIRYVHSVYHARSERKIHFYTFRIL
jgi:hypothetical protein